MNESLGEGIRRLREKNDLSLRELAKKIDVSAVFLSDIELGRRFPSSETLKKIAEFLGENIEALKELDARPPISEIKLMSEKNPRLGFAFRKAIEDLRTNEMTEEDLIKRLSGKKTKR